MENIKLEDYVEVDSLDFLTKYAIIITNFIIIITLVIYNKYFKKSDDSPSKEINNILIVIANPTDIVQYFLPTITNHQNDYNFHILCLSNGGLPEQDKIIEKEFEKSCLFLGISKFMILQDELLQQKSKNTWSASHISNRIIDYLQENNIKALISFDEFAINLENNQMAISKAIKLMLLDEEKKNKLPQILKIYELITVNFFRKMLGLWDFLFCILQYYVFLNINITKNLKLMSFYRSQLSFGQKIRLFFSRYSYVNTLKRLI